MDKAFAKKKNIDYVAILPIVFFAAGVLLTVKIHPYKMPLSSYSFLGVEDGTVLYDCFSYYKMLAICIDTACALVIFLYYLITGKIRLKKTIFYIPIALYSLFVVLSYALSDYKYFAWNGSPDRFEGTMVHLCYIVMLVYIINMVSTADEIKFIVKCIFIGINFACIIGITQAFGTDFFGSDFGKWLIGAQKGYEVGLEFAKGQVYQTIYNINYVGWYLSLIIPILVIFIAKGIDDIMVMSENKQRLALTEYKNIYAQRISEVIFWLILLGMIIINVGKSDSLGSIPGIIVSLAGTLLYLLIKRKDTGKSFAVMVMALLAFIMLAGVCFYKGNLSSKADGSDRENAIRPDISRIVTNDNCIEMVMNGKTLKIYCDVTTGEVVATDGEKDIFNLFKSPYDDYRYEMDSPDFNGIVSVSPLVIDDRYIIGLNLPEETLFFVIDGMEVKYINRCDNPVGLDEVKHAKLIKDYRFASGRGYVWDTTLPLLSKYIFVGSGADTFMFVFPQEDVAGRYSGKIGLENIYDKPHNMYLQMAVCTGALSAICFIALLVLYFAGVIRTLKISKTVKMPDRRDDEREAILVALAMGVLAFMTGALVNDSCVSVMPVFYTILGLGIAAYIQQRKVLTDQQENNQIFAK